MAESILSPMRARCFLQIYEFNRKYFISHLCHLSSYPPQSGF